MKQYWNFLMALAWCTVLLFIIFWSLMTWSESNKTKPDTRETITKDNASRLNY